MIINVLVIDDSLTVRAIIEQILSNNRDINVIGSAKDVISAKELIRKRRPSVITLDLAMPGIDGLSFLAELSCGPHAPVLVVSSMTTRGSEVCEIAMAHGAVGCFDKAELVSHASEFRRTLKRSATLSSRSRTPAAIASQLASDATQVK